MRSVLLSASLTSLMIIITVTNQSLAKIEQDSIVGLWLFDEVAGERIRDYSGNRHDGKIIGAKRIEGKFGKALQFDGDDFVTVSDAEELRIGEQFTMQAWFFAKDIGNWRQIIAKSDEYLLRIDPPQEGNKMSVFVKAAGNWEPRASAFVPKMETWIHFAATYDSTLSNNQLKVYVDGALIGQSSRPGKIQKTTNPVEEGRWSGHLLKDDIGYFVGIIDEVAIFSATLTENDIKETMDGLRRFGAHLEASEKLAVIWGSIKEY